MPVQITRRSLLATGFALALSPPAFASPAARHDWVVGHIPDKPFDIDLINMEQVAPEYHRQVVPFTGPEPAGTLVVDAAKRHIYFVLLNGTAVRYGTAVGRQGASWHGTAIVGRKAKWPTWTPTANMRKRDAKLPISMKGGPKNPLGACALFVQRWQRHALPHPRHERPFKHRQICLIRLYPHVQRTHLRTLRRSAGGDEGGGEVREGTLLL